MQIITKDGQTKCTSETNYPPAAELAIRGGIEMICDNCIHQKACINAYASMGYFINETRENEYKHTILKCKEFEDKKKFQEVKREHWIEQSVSFDLCGIKYYHCSLCDKSTQIETPFCPWCGAKMDGEEK